MKKTTKKKDEVKHEGVRFAELPVGLQGAGTGSAWELLAELDTKGRITGREREDCELHRYRLNADDEIDAIYPVEMLNSGEPVKWGLGRYAKTWELLPFLANEDAAMSAAEIGAAAAGVLPLAPRGFVILPRAQIQPWPGQPRKSFDEAAQCELDASMTAKGFDEAFPLIVRATHGSVPYELAAGERRWRSAGRVGIASVPCIVRDLSDDEMMEMALVENLQREGLSALEEALGYRALIAAGKRSVAEVAKMIGKSADTVRDRLALCKLAGTPTGEALEAGRITPRHAAALARVPSDKSRDELLSAVLKPAGQPGPLPVVELERRIMLDFVRDLRGCKFDVADVTLVPEQADADGNRTMGGACGSCPFNTLVADPSRKGKSSGAMCSHPECYRAKEEATHERWRASQSAETLPAQDNARLWNQTGKELAYNSPYVDLDAKPDRADLGAKADELPKWSTLVKGAEVPVLLAVDAAGKVRTLARREVVVEAVKVMDAEKPPAEKILEEPKKVKKTDGESKADALKKKRDVELAEYVEAEKFRAIVEASRMPLLDLPIGFPQLAISELADTLEALGGGRLESIMVRRGWWAEDEECAYDTVMRKLDAMEGEHFKVELMVEMLMQLSSKTDITIADWAYLFDVDVKKAGKAAEKTFAASEAQQAGKEAVIKGVRWITKRKTTADEFQWDDTVCKNEDCAVVDIGKGMIAHITIARVEKGWVYGWALEIGGAVHGEKASRVGAKYGTPELATVSALTALRLEVERKGGTDEQLVKLTDYIKLAQKGAGEK